MENISLKENDIVTITQEMWREYAQYCNDHGLYLDPISDNQYGVRSSTYTPSEEELKRDLRKKRECECFPYINRGTLWYQTLTKNQVDELQEWYTKWLYVTETFIIPEKPRWL